MRAGAIVALLLAWNAAGTSYALDLLVPGGLTPAGQQRGAAATPPSISSLDPAAGPAGTMVTVSGKGFLPTSGNGSAADFGGNTVHLGSQVIRNQNSEDGLTLRFQVPADIAAGTYNVSISNENGASNTVTFTVTRS